MVFAGLDLSRRLERAEGAACAEFASARARLQPQSGAAWIECAGAYVVFDGVESPATQSFGLGIFEELTASTLDRVEGFFFARGADAQHEISPHAGVPAIDLLCSRGYRPVEVCNVLYRPVEVPATDSPANIRVRATGPGEAHLWADVGARGWGHEHPELTDFLRECGDIAAGRQNSLCFVAEIGGQPGAAAALCLHEGVALFAGSATAPEFRRRGLQAALFRERMRHALTLGCDLAMVVAAPGSDSQRNAERSGFRIAYSRTKWKLSCGSAK